MNSSKLNAHPGQFLAELQSLFAKYETLFAPVGVRITVEQSPQSRATRLLNIIVPYVAAAFDVERSHVLQLHRTIRTYRESDARRLSMIFLQDFDPSLSDAMVAGFFKLERTSLRAARKWCANTCDVNPTFRSNLNKMRMDLAELLHEKAVEFDAVRKAA